MRKNKIYSSFNKLKIIINVKSQRCQNSFFLKNELNGGIEHFQISDSFANEGRGKITQINKTCFGFNK